MPSGTNVSSFWNMGNLEFHQGDPLDPPGPLLMKIDATHNGLNFQLPSTAIAAGNSQATNFGVALQFTDNTGTVYYIPAKVSSIW